MIRGKLKFPGDKSISHRALIFTALSNGKCVLENLSTGKDVESTRICLAQCGIRSNKFDNKIEIFGNRLHHPINRLDCGNSGTSARLLIGLLSGQKMEAEFIGDESLSQRPMQRIIDPLNEMGADIECKDNHLPIKLAGNKLAGISYKLPIASAQVKSALLLAGLGASDDTTITEPIATRNHTELMLNKLGADIQMQSNTIRVSPLNEPLPTFDMLIPGDPSTAAFFTAAATLMPYSDLIIGNVSANPTRTGFLNILQKMNGKIEWQKKWTTNGEEIGTLRIQHSQLHSVNITENDVPSIIDEIPILAILATQAEGITKIQGAAELRVKESDRINAICVNLRHMGANIIEHPDGFTITGPTQLKSSKIETFNDHRIAMAFTIAGLATNVSIELDNPRCVDISFPEFYTFLNQVT